MLSNHRGRRAARLRLNLRHPHLPTIYKLILTSTYPIYLGTARLLLGAQTGCRGRDGGWRSATCLVTYGDLFPSVSIDGLSDVCKYVGSMNTAQIFNLCRRHYLLQVRWHASKRRGIPSVAVEHIKVRDQYLCCLHSSPTQSSPHPISYRRYSPSTSQSLPT